MVNLTTEILNAMVDGEKHSPEEVSRRIGRPYNNVKRHMSRMFKDMHILERPDYGWYQIPKIPVIKQAIEDDKEVPPTIHTIRMIGQLPEIMHFEPPRPPSGTGTQGDVKGDVKGDAMQDFIPIKEFLAQKYPNQSSLDTWMPEGPKMVRRKDWEGRKAEIRICNKTIEVDLAASHMPLVLPEVWAFKQYIRGLLEPWFDMIQWEKCLLGYNYDFANMTMAWDKEGKIKIMGWQVLDLEVRRWYEKHGFNALRRETHAPIIVTPGEILQNLKGEGEPGVTALLNLVGEKFESYEQSLREVMTELKHLKAAETKIVTVAHELDVNTRDRRPKKLVE